MKKVIIILAVVVGLGIAYWLLSPLFLNRTINESVEDIKKQSNSSEQYQVLFSGNFEGLGGHNAEGQAQLIKVGDKYYIRLEENFKVTNGPDLFVYLGKNGQYDPNTKLDSLKGNIGSQNYEVPISINIQEYNEVWVWCRSFSVPFGKAVLK